MINLSGQAALITGGTQGVGGAIARTLAQAGCDLLLHGLRDDHYAAATIADCRRHGAAVEAVYLDLTRPVSTAVQTLVEHAAKLARPVSCLVNNVGVYIDRPFLEMDEETYDRTFQLNVKLGYFLTQAFARQWIARGVEGRVLFTGSINGLLAEPTHTAYDASKAAVAGLVRSLCVSLAPHRIRVNSMAPGLVRTPLTNQVLDTDANALHWMRLHTPNGEVPGPEVCGGAAAFLLSDLASHVHGQTIYVDGGMSVWQQPDPPPG